MPAPADIQTSNGGGPQGRIKRGDTISFTFAAVPNPSLILSGWNGLGTKVTVRVANNGTNDVLTVLDGTTGAQLLALGSVQLGGNYTQGMGVGVTVPGSTMTLSGTVVTIVLGTPSGKVHDEKKPGTMVWTAPSGTASESGPADSEF
jgi:hypothetical protein